MSEEQPYQAKEMSAWAKEIDKGQKTAGEVFEEMVQAEAAKSTVDKQRDVPKVSEEKGPIQKHIEAAQAKKVKGDPSVEQLRAEMQDEIAQRGKERNIIGKFFRRY